MPPRTRLPFPLPFRFSRTRALRIRRPRSPPASSRSSTGSAGIWSPRACRPRARKSPRAWAFRTASSAEDHLRALAQKGRARAHARRVARPAPEGHAGAAGARAAAAGRPRRRRPPDPRRRAHRGARAVDPALFAPRADYLLRVRGASMRDAGILDGDLLAVHRTADARSGQIVVARLSGAATRSRSSA